jgi:phytoene/squalene synthetase
MKMSPKEKNKTAKRQALDTLAKTITWAGSKQTYIIGQLMVDKSLKKDFFLAYAYFRWIDDVIDISSESQEERITFIKRQRDLIDQLYKNKKLEDLTPEEKIIAKLISHDKTENSGLKSFILNMFAVIEFDVYRKNRNISQKELTWYLDTLGKSVIDGLLYFIGNDHNYPNTKNKYHAVIGAHITHLLRDMLQDIDNGFINIPNEYLKTHDISPEDINKNRFKAWVESRVKTARNYFLEGKRYLDSLGVLRSKLVGYWYIARFEGVLNIIEQDKYKLRYDYNEHRKPATILKIISQSISIIFKHIFSKFTILRYKNKINLIKKKPQPYLDL